MTDIGLMPGTVTSGRLFDRLEPQPADALLSLIALHRQDARPSKMDLGVGVYRDDRGETPVMRCIKAAERQLAAGQATKAYLGPEGDTRFTELLARIALGENLADDARITGVQTPGGTGALRLAAEAIARGNPNARIWVGVPTWPNHGPIFREAGLKVETHAFYDAGSGEIAFQAMLADLENARPGDVLLLHGCCHNPTGAEFTHAQWLTLIALIADRKLVPLIDLAYQGLGAGLEADAWAVRQIVATAAEAIVAYSCDKNFGLYRDRVGALWIKGDAPERTAAIRDAMLVLARSLWSMPPDHGAAAVRIVLATPDLAADWRIELEAMRRRIVDLRNAIASASPRLAPLARQGGMFAMLPITRETVLALRRDTGIYMADSGRINIAGLRADTVDAFVTAIAPHLDTAELLS